MIPEVTIKITMTEGAVTTTADEGLVTTGAGTIPPPPEVGQGVSETEADVPAVPQDVAERTEVHVAPPAVQEGAVEDIAVPPLPQETGGGTTEGDSLEFNPPGVGEELAEDEFSVPPVPAEEAERISIAEHDDMPDLPS